MNSYFDDLYSEVYEYTYDVITEKKNPPKRGGGIKKKKLKPKIKTKLKHKKRNLLLLIGAMIAAFVVIKKIILNSEHQYEQRTGRQKYNSIKSAYKKNDNSIADRTYAYDHVYFFDRNIKDDKDITISYCNKMIKELTKDKKVINDLDIENYKQVRNALIIEKRLKNPLTRLLDSKYLSSSMRKRIQMLYDKNKTNIDNVNNWDDFYEEIEDEEDEEIEDMEEYDE